MSLQRAGGSRPARFLLRLDRAYTCRPPSPGARLLARHHLLECGSHPPPRPLQPSSLPSRCSGRLPSMVFTSAASSTPTCGPRLLPFRATLPLVARTSATHPSHTLPWMSEAYLLWRSWPCARGDFLRLSQPSMCTEHGRTLLLLPEMVIFSPHVDSSHPQTTHKWICPRLCMAGAN